MDKERLDRLTRGWESNQVLCSDSGVLRDWGLDGEKFDLLGGQ